MDPRRSQESLVSHYSQGIPPTQTHQTSFPQASSTTSWPSSTTCANPTSPHDIPKDRHSSSTTHTSGGHRSTNIPPRGVAILAGSAESEWLRIIQTIIQYTFKNPDLLEEALESPNSGVTCVGQSHRHFEDGNRGLAKVGQSAMKLLLRDQCYLFQIPEGDAEKIISDMIHFRNLDQLGRTTKLERFVRPKLYLRPTRRRNPLWLLKDDVQREDPSRTIARAVCAIIGAAYYDGGLEAAKGVMAELDLVINMPK
ncbi:uncharacterized protein BP5553_08383 [Venustampulla echinocandica]|uniref:Uncharacterized protein n=1 Tax=Venustampulla echinocandica TaxID=2656787 RepID=A0A370TE25_9HELO|nr:uncharacterized protein BP5553_08383 [Venustampulla echinocandica]RDL32944.1 hypothetical protein BP5553_08383 [Venustampulla echinocandica]